jgi:AraC-like DNA-binding protein
METYRASSLPSRTKAASWNEIYSSCLEKADCSLTDQDQFEAEISLGELGPIRVIRMQCGGNEIERAPRHILASGGKTYSFILQSRGAGVFIHYGHETALSEGDFTLCDGAAPYSLKLNEGSEVVILRIPAKILKEHLPSPEFFCGRRLAAREGLTHTAAAVTRSIWTQLEAGLSGEFQERIARNLLDVIATSYAIAFHTQITTSSNMSGRHANVKLYIEQHLREPRLSPRSIADTLKLSPRYLRMIFASSDETVSAYILRRRLEESARQMADPRWSGHSITEIAFAWGFNSAPHFTRSFRDRYNVAPREYRRLTAEGRLAMTMTEAA